MDEKRRTIRDRQFFTSRVLALHFEDMAVAQTRRYRYNRRVRVRLSWDPGIPEKEWATIPNISLKPVVELSPRYREGGFRLAEAEKIHFNDPESLKQRGGAEFPAYLGKVSRLLFYPEDLAKRVEITLPLCWGSVMERLAGGKVPFGTVQRNWAISNERNIFIDFGTGSAAGSKEGSGK